MPFLRLCESDPLVTVLLDVFQANIIRVPRSDINPLWVVASKHDHSSLRGRLENLLKEDRPIAVSPETRSLANLTGKRSRKVDLKLGIAILEGILNGFSLPSAAIVSKLQGATKLSFSFQDVKQVVIDIGGVGRELAGRRIDKKNPAAAIFFGEDAWSLLVIDSVITSREFTIGIDTIAEQGLALDVEGIKHIVSGANVGVEVSTSTGYDLSFRGAKDMAFAFTCVEVDLDTSGTITELPPDLRKRTLGSPQPHVLLDPKPSMVDWDVVELPRPNEGS